MDLRQKILGTEEPPLTLREFPVPEWNCSVWIRGWTAAEMDTVGRWARDKVPNFQARVLCLVLCDQSGKRLFRDEDVEAIGEKFAPTVHRIYAATEEISGATEESAETARKNSLSGQSAASSDG